MRWPVAEEGAGSLRLSEAWQLGAPAPGAIEAQSMRPACVTLLKPTTRVASRQAGQVCGSPSLSAR